MGPKKKVFTLLTWFVLFFYEISLHLFNNLHTSRFRRALPMLDLMTQKPSRVQSSTGSRPEVGR
jgi:hypothetical protein